MSFAKKIHSITFMKAFQNSSMKSFEKEFDFKFLHIMNFFGWFGVIWNCNASNFFQQFFLGLQWSLLYRLTDVDICHSFEKSQYWSFQAFFVTPNIHYELLSVPK